MTPFDFVDYLALADTLASQPDGAAWRTSISRSYYAVLHAAYQALPAAHRIAISYGATHRATWNLYVVSSVPGCRQVGNAGLRLRDGGVNADYRATPPVVRAEAIRMVAYARQSLERLQLYGYQP